MEQIFDHRLLAMRRARAIARAAGGADFLLRRAAAEMAERLALVERRFDHPVIAHGTTAIAADLMEATGKTARFSFIDSGAVPGIGDRRMICASPDALPMQAGTADLVVSPLALHVTNDTPGVLVQALRMLKPDGLFLAAVAGAGTLSELRQSLLAAESTVSNGAHARVHPFADVREYGALLQRAGFALPVADVDEITVRYDDMFALMRDLRSMGMTSALIERSRKPASRTLFTEAARIYAERFSDPDGRIRASFPIIHLSGWAPHHSQQKPLRPGSAQARLADALGAPERKLPR